MAEKTLKSDNIRVHKKEFHKSKQPIDLISVNIGQIVVSDKFKHSNEGFKYFIGYQENEMVKPLRIILPQMSGYIKYFGKGGKNMSFLRFFFYSFFVLCITLNNFFFGISFFCFLQDFLPIKPV